MDAKYEDFSGKWIRIIIKYYCKFKENIFSVTPLNGNAVISFQIL